LSPVVTAYGSQTGEHVLDELAFGVWVARAPNGETLYANRAFRTIMGMDAVADADISTVPAIYGIHDRQGKLYAAEALPFSRALARGESVVVDDLVVHRRDGTRAWLRAIANPVRDGRGVVSHVIVAFTEITSEVRALVERAEIEKHLEVAIHHAPVLLFTIDRQGILTAAEGALRAILEQGRNMLGQSLFEAYKDHPTVPGNVRLALAGETVSYSVDVRGLALDVWIGPLRDAAGELVGAIGVCTDVTESRRLQTHIIRDDRIRAMGTMAASVAHEINNPLTYVLGGLEEATTEVESLAAELAAAGADADAAAAAALRALGRLREQLAPALAGTRRIREVTHQLSTFTRPDDEHLAPVDVATAVRSVLKLVGKEIEARARLVEEVGVSAVVLANEARLVQVFVNLLMNAWQALPTSDPARHVIGVRTAVQGDDALIEIWDSGPGIPPHLREQIFEPFITTKDVGMGTGLGLFVCRNIIDALHGRITVDEAPGGGALFRVVLPRTTQTASAPAPAPPIEAGPRSGVRRPRILIIDDDAMVAHALAARLSAELFDVRTVLDARRGLEIILGDDDLDLVYCDLMMKGFTGIDLHRSLQREAPQRLSRVVFMTGGAFTGEAQSFLDQQLPDAFVQKPFDIVADARRRVG
jgi:two-component system cell cycle sensor histidine kinase/response regulator CckA